MKAGVLVDLSGLQAKFQGRSRQVCEGKTTVIDGPFAETKELIGGLLDYRRQIEAEAIEWAKWVPATAWRRSGRRDRNPSVF